MTRSLRNAALAVASLSLACTPKVCTPGSTQLCVGAGGCQGGQACSADGTGYGECVCAQTNTGTDGGGGTITGGDSGVTMIGIDAGVSPSADGGPTFGADSGVTPSLDAGQTTGDGGVLQCLPSGGYVNGVVTIAGTSSFAGVTVTIPALNTSVQSSPDGSYSFPCVPVGQYSLQFSKESFTETIPAIQTYVGANAQVVDTAYYALLPLELVSGTRLQSFKQTGLSSGVQLTMTADGRYIAYYVQDNGGTLFLTDLDAGTSTVLQANATSQLFTLSPDETRLYWVASTSLGQGPGTLTSRLIAGGSNTVMKTGVATLPVFSRDGQRLAFGDSTNVYLLRVDGTQPTNLGVRSTACESAFQGEFAADSTLIWKGATGLGNCVPMALHLTPADGGVDRVLGSVGAYSLSGDGIVLAFSNLDAGSMQALTIGANTPVSIGPVSHSSTSAPVVISGDHSRVVYVDPTYNLIEARADGSGSRTLANNVNGCQLYGFSPSSQLSLFAKPGSHTCDLVAAPADGGAPIVVGTNIDTNSRSGGCGGLCPEAWLFNQGKLLLIDGLAQYNAPGDLRVLIVGGASTTIDSNVSGIVKLNPEGSHGAYTIGTSIVNNTLKLFAFAGGTPVVLGTNGFFGPYSPNGARLAFASDCNNDSTDCSLQTVLLSTGVVTLVAQHVRGYGYEWAPDGRGLAFSGAGGPVRFVPISGAPATFADRTEFIGWTDPTHFVGLRAGTPAPYQFQDGLYVFSVGQ